MKGPLPKFLQCKFNLTISKITIQEVFNAYLSFIYTNDGMIKDDNDDDGANNDDARMTAVMKIVLIISFTMLLIKLRN